MNILAIVNTYSLYGLPDHLRKCLIGWATQAIDANIDVVLSNNVPLANVSEEASQCFATSKHNFYVANIFDHYPVYTTFNATIKAFNSRKKYDLYVYCSQDCVMTKPTDLSVMVSDLDSSVGIVSGLVDQDNSMFYPHYNQRRESSQVVALSESVNMHQFIFSREFMEKYDFKYIDILGAWATESLLTFLCAAISKKWVHCTRVLLNHDRVVKPRGFDGHVIFTYHGYQPINGMGQIAYYNIFSKGQSVGLGFECCEGWFPYDRGLYVDGECICKDKLHKYIRDNLFLTSDVLDYDNIVSRMQIIEVKSA